MKPRIRKLNTDDIKSLEELDNYNAKIIIEELSSKEDNQIFYEAYGIFIEYNTIVGCCSISDSDEYDSYKYWDDNSKAISELYLKDEYNNDLDLYCELLSFILEDESNKDSNIFFDNNINLPSNYYEQLGFVTIQDGVLVRLSETFKKENNLEEA